MSGQENIVHASDSVENAQIELARFFKKEELFNFRPSDIAAYYAPDEP
jgi:nucleoside-diphosphate kinase